MSEFVRGRDHFLAHALDISKVVLPERLNTIDGMISVRERQVLYRIARDHYQGQGFVVDGGMFLGASGACLAEGLRANDEYNDFMKSFGDRRPIVGYELGVLPAVGPTAHQRTYGGTVVRFGESFVPVLLRNMKPYRAEFEVIVGDFLEQVWPKADPIEICFIDVAKTPELNQHVFRQLFPSLIPGRSLVVQQDFFFDRLPWIKVLMGYLADYFQWMGQVGPSSVYRYVRQIPPDMFEIDPYSDLPGHERLRLHALSQDSRLPDRRRFALDLSLAYLQWEVEGPDAASDHLDAIAARYAGYVDDPTLGASALTRITRARRSMGIVESPRLKALAAASPLQQATGETLDRLRSSVEQMMRAGEQILREIDRLSAADAQSEAQDA